MEILYSNILPLCTLAGQQTFIDRFKKSLSCSDRVDIATGYVSKAGLQELDSLIQQSNVKQVEVVMGMYYLEGMPESTYNLALSLNEKWKNNNLGKIKLVKALKYHGKLYVFYKDGKPVEAFIGSHNLGSIKLEASNLRQYEISAVTTTPEEVQEIADFVDNLKSERISADIADVDSMKIIRERNTALEGQEFVSRITLDEVEIYKKKLTDIQFEIPLKVPQDLNDQNMRGSNINVCYAKGRKRVWWETEIVVSKQIRECPGYPQFQRPFMAVTDDGWKFLAWTCGATNKNFYSKDDLKIMGRWIKGRLVAAGLVDPVNRVEDDTEGKGIITGEMLKKYGRDTITLTKTSLTTVLENGTEVEVWLLSFLPKE